MLIDSIRQKILEQAFQGKLVEQRPEEGSAEELYQQIQEEKQRLIAEGTIKRERVIRIVEDRKPAFDIPGTWKWVKLASITYPVGNKNNQIQAKEVAPSGRYPAISQGAELIDGYSDNEERAIHDLPLIMFGDHTRNVKFIDFPFIICADGTKLMKAICACPLYLYYWVLFTAKKLKNRGYARHFSLLNAESVPLPPLQEQYRIVERVNALFAKLNTIIESKERISSLKTALTKRILDKAIQGKLVPQRPEEGTAEELYQQIQAEKQRLIAAGTIKKEKPLPPIEEKDHPFDIPETWKWVRLGDCTNFGQTKQKARATDISDDTWIADLEDIEKSSGQLLRRITSKERKIAGDKTIFKKGDILFSKLRPYLQKILIANESGVCTSELVPFSPYGDIDPQYLLYVLKSPTVDSTINTSTYGMKMPRVGRDTMLNLLIPLPPHAEQKRIIAKIEEMLTLCKTLQ